MSPCRRTGIFYHIAWRVLRAELRKINFFYFSACGVVSPFGTLSAQRQKRRGEKRQEKRQCQTQEKELRSTEAHGLSQPSLNGCVQSPRRLILTLLACLKRLGVEKSKSPLKENMMRKKFVKIDEATYDALVKVAHDNGFDSVEKLLTEFAEDFSTGCSVTLKGARRVA